MFGLAAFVTIVGLGLAVGGLVPRRLRLPLWTMVVMAGVVPWSNWAGHAHWHLVDWWPLLPLPRLRDVVLNVLLYVPIGYFFMQSRIVAPRRPRIAAAITYGWGLSVLTELSQVYGHGRYPDADDVVNNTIGAVCGMALAVFHSRAGGRESA